MVEITFVIFKTTQKIFLIIQNLMRNMLQKNKNIKVGMRILPQKV